MYDEPRYRRPVGVHEGTYHEHLARHTCEAVEAAAGGAAARRAFADNLFARAVDERNLRCAWDHLSRNGGRVPGPDRMRYDDLDDREVWSHLRAVRDLLKAGQYRRGPVRRVRIPKASGTGTRTLTLAFMRARDLSWAQPVRAGPM